jgi:serine/threonine-protein kinase
MDHIRATKILIQALGALEEAHGAGVIHRDLKPENILLTTQGGIPDTPKVLDFGLAKIKDQSPRPGSMVLTREGMVFGTPEFMSPEQARGETLDGRSDIYSVGVIFYEMLTARLPFPRCKPMEYISHHINTPPFPVTERRPELGLPKELDPILGKALEKKREDRYATAKEFAQALQALLPRSAQSGPMHAIPAAGRMEQTEEIRTTETLPEVPVKTQGKGLVIALIAVILVLLAVVIWLVARDSPDDTAVVPLQPIGQPAPLPPTGGAQPPPPGGGS